MNCEEIQDLLDEYLDGELSEPDRAAVSAHLAGCESCRAELRELEATASLVSSLPRAKAPPDLAGSVQAEIERTASARTRAILRWTGVGSWVAAAATLLLVARLVAWVPNESGPAGDRAIQDPARAGSISDARKARKEADGTAERRAIGERGETLAMNTKDADRTNGAPGRDEKGGAGWAAGEGAGGQRALRDGAGPTGAPPVAAANAAIKTESTLRATGAPGAVEAERAKTAEAAIPEFAFKCPDLKTGSAELAKMVAAVPGAKVLVNDVKDKAADGVFLVSVPADRLADLTGKMERVVKPAATRGANTLNAAREAKSAPADGQGAAPAAFAGGAGGGMEMGALKQPTAPTAAVTIRVALKVEPKN